MAEAGRYGARRGRTAPAPGTGRILPRVRVPPCPRRCKGTSRAVQGQKEPPGVGGGVTPRCRGSGSRLVPGARGDAAGARNEPPQHAMPCPARGAPSRRGTHACPAQGCPEAPRWSAPAAGFCHRLCGGDRRRPPPPLQPPSRERAAPAATQCGPSSWHGSAHTAVPLASSPDGRGGGAARALI